MRWFSKVLSCVVCSLLLFVCALALLDVALSVQTGSASGLTNPFVLIVLGIFALHSTWYVCLLFGLWLGFLPPRRWPAYVVLCLFALVAGVRTSYSYQMYKWPEYPFQAGMEQMAATFHLASVTTLVACLIAVTSTILCSLMSGLLLFHSPPPNHALQRTIL